jgi:hypothetical protein
MRVMSIERKIADFLVALPREMLNCTPRDRDTRILRIKITQKRPTRSCNVRAVIIAIRFAVNFIEIYARRLRKATFDFYDGFH